jgi:hypothetical protein
MERLSYYPVDCSLTSMLHSVSWPDKTDGEDLFLKVPARGAGIGDIPGISRDKGQAARKSL